MKRTATTVALILIGATASAADPDNSQDTVSSSAAARPTTLATAIRDRYKKSGYDYPVRRRPDATFEKRTGYRNMNFRMAHIGADGKLETVCAHGAEQAARFVENVAARETTDKKVTP